MLCDGDVSVLATAVDASAYASGDVQQEVLPCLHVPRVLLVPLS